MFALMMNMKQTGIQCLEIPGVGQMIARKVSDEGCSSHSHSHSGEVLYILFRKVPVSRREISQPHVAYDLPFQTSLTIEPTSQ
jgi:hypothetical protein